MTDLRDRLVALVGPDTDALIDVVEWASRVDYNVSAIAAARRALDKLAALRASSFPNGFEAGWLRGREDAVEVADASKVAAEALRGAISEAFVNITISTSETIANRIRALPSPDLGLERVPGAAGGDPAESGAGP